MYKFGCCCLGRLPAKTGFVMTPNFVEIYQTQGSPWCFLLKEIAERLSNKVNNHKGTRDYYFASNNTWTIPFQLLVIHMITIFSFCVKPSSLLDLWLKVDDNGGVLVPKELRVNCFCQEMHSSPLYFATKRNNDFLRFWVGRVACI